ncbi:hypothetical protein [Sphingomonas radiodurans]|nr:hypothetical protein [Sphingomonas radiodurans]WBH16368.1 hypothetical protein LLW23_16485 [Sphingomonas radiodurans]
MTQFANIGRTLAAAACAIVLSTAMVLGAVGPAQTGSANPIVRAIA